MLTDPWFWMVVTFSIGLFVGLSIERANTKAEVRAAQLALIDKILEQARRLAVEKESKG